ncbi:MAG: hypothetical protein MJ252_06775 [archaeon]|nr:hypothetical protein [archaeon]
MYPNRNYFPRGYGYQPMYPNGFQGQPNIFPHPQYNHGYPYGQEQPFDFPWNQGFNPNYDPRFIQSHQQSQWEERRNFIEPKMESRMADNQTKVFTSIDQLDPMVKKIFLSSMNKFVNQSNPQQRTEQTQFDFEREFMNSSFQDDLVNENQNQIFLRRGFNARITPRRIDEDDLLYERPVNVSLNIKNYFFVSGTKEEPQEDPKEEPEEDPKESPMLPERNPQQSEAKSIKSSRENPFKLKESFFQNVQPYQPSAEYLRNSMNAKINPKEDTISPLYKLSPLLASAEKDPFNEQDLIEMESHFESKDDYKGMRFSKLSEGDSLYDDFYQLPTKRIKPMEEFPMPEINKTEKKTKTKSTFDFLYKYSKTNAKGSPYVLKDDLNIMSPYEGRKMLPQPQEEEIQRNIPQNKKEVFGSKESKDSYFDPNKCTLSKLSPMEYYSSSSSHSQTIIAPPPTPSGNSKNSSKENQSKFESKGNPISMDGQMINRISSKRNQSKMNHPFSKQNQMMNLTETNGNIEGNNTQIQMENNTQLPSSNQTQINMEIPSPNTIQTDNQSVNIPQPQQIQPQSMDIVMENPQQESTQNPQLRIESKHSVIVSPVQKYSSYDIINITPSFSFSFQGVSENKKDFIKNYKEAVSNLKSDYDKKLNELNKLKLLLAQTKESFQTNFEQLEINESRRIALNEHIHNLRGNIRIFCRVKPLFNGETSFITYPQLISSDAQKNDSKVIKNPNLILQNSNKTKATIVTTLKYDTSIPLVKASSGEINEFTFDRIFTGDVSQAEVFGEVKGFIQTALDGQDVCLFAYGATDSGKSYTMEGEGMENENGVMVDKRGILPRCTEFIFEEKKRLQPLGVEIILSFTAIEIYNENVYDLLDNEEYIPQNPKESIFNSAFPKAKKNKMGDATNQKNKTNKKNNAKKERPSLTVHCANNEVNIPNLTREAINNEEDILRLTAKASESRRTNSTLFNSKSSRSHAIFQISLLNKKTGITSTINIVDLAGNERRSQLNKSLADMTPEEIELNKFQQMEANYINKSLTTLGRIITIISDKKNANKTVLPYRDSKLTILLQKYLKPNSKTTMIINISPDVKNFKYTKETLTFASTALNIH